MSSPSARVHHDITACIFIICVYFQTLSMGLRGSQWFVCPEDQNRLRLYIQGVLMKSQQHTLYWTQQMIWWCLFLGVFTETAMYILFFSSCLRATLSVLWRKNWRRCKEFWVQITQNAYTVLRTRSCGIGMKRGRAAERHFWRSHCISWGEQSTGSWLTVCRAVRLRDLNTFSLSDPTHINLLYETFQWVNVLSRCCISGRLLATD